jgi:nucleoside-diphosphate-sugar epimerase
VIEATAAKVDIEFLPSSEDRIVPFRWFSIKHARKVLGWNPKTDMKSGISKVVDWYRENGKK